MKKLFTIALCALLAAVAAEAKTYYVNASRPNNNGNGLKPKTAKKTIQAAINIAKDGDTILVYPGTYAPIKTNNKKLTIKSAKGASKTAIVKPAKQKAGAIAQLGKAWKQSYVDSHGKTQYYSSAPYTKGKNTTLAGFLLDGKNRDNGENWLLGVSGGSLKSCSIRGLGQEGNWYWDGLRVAVNADLLQCEILGNHAPLAENCVLGRCRLQDNVAERYAYYFDDGHDYVSGGFVFGSRLSNCLIAGNRFRGTSGTASYFTSSTLLNCTIAQNHTGHDRAPFSRKSKYYNCILRNNGRGDANAVHNTDSGNAYNRTFKNNKNPKFADVANRNYKLAKGSPCINKGKLTAAQKKQLGSRDLAGGKRIKGKAVDLGCYEF